MSGVTPVTLDRIREAYGPLKPIVRRTPLLTSRTLDAMAGGPIHLKAENLQKTGSFKIRGAYTALSRLPAADRAKGVVTASAGNHAQGIALAAQLTGLKAKVFMPLGASIAKVLATRGYGADVQLAGGSFDEAVAAAEAFARDSGAPFISAFDHDDIIAGQGSVALELLEDLPDLETVIIPVGGGGLISGMAVALKETRPSIRVIGVQSEGCAAAAESWRAGTVVASPHAKTIADGIAVKKPSMRTVQHMKKHVDDIVTVSDEEISTTIVTLLERMKILVEGAGAAALTAHGVHGEIKGLDGLVGGDLDHELRPLADGQAHVGADLRAHVADGAGHVAARKAVGQVRNEGKQDVGELAQDQLHLRELELDVDVVELRRDRVRLQQRRR